MFIYTLILSLQINRNFMFRDIEQILINRLPNKKYYILNYENLENQDVKISFNKKPSHAIVSYESEKLHFFLYNNKCISNCIWDGNVNHDKKKEIIKNMLSWWNKDYILFHQKILDVNDKLLFEDVLDEINESNKSNRSNE